MPFTYEDMAAAGSMLGPKAPRCLTRRQAWSRGHGWLEFYKQSRAASARHAAKGPTGSSTCCDRLESGTGTDEDIARINDISSTDRRTVVLRAW